MIKLRSALVKDFMMRQSDFINVHLLGADTHETDDLPTGARYAIVTSETLAYVKVSATSFALPGDTTDGTGPKMLPAGVPVLLDCQALFGVAAASQKIGLRAAGTPRVTIEWFA